VKIQPKQRVNLTVVPEDWWGEEAAELLAEE